MREIQVDVAIIGAGTALRGFATAWLGSNCWRNLSNGPVRRPGVESTKPTG
jgi:hypothetical protein